MTEVTTGRDVRPPRVVGVPGETKPREHRVAGLLARRVAGVAYETVQTNTGALPLLAPMSELAGRLAPQVGARFLERESGGRGMLLGGVPGVPPGRVVVLGAGTVGFAAAAIAQGMGAEVRLLNRGSSGCSGPASSIGAGS